VYPTINPETKMKILSIRPAPPGSATLAHVDIELVDGVKMYGIRVSRADDGTYRAFGQNSDRGRTCAFSPAVVADITAATLSELELTGHRTNDRTLN
jgi:hypothetical protein